VDQDPAVRIAAEHGGDSMKPAVTDSLTPIHDIQHSIMLVNPLH
jgi:hypothetical protein